MFNWKGALRSKKFKMASGAVLMVLGLVLTGKITPDLAMDAIWKMVVAYLTGQSLIDFKNGSSQ